MGRFRGGFTRVNASSIHIGSVYTRFGAKIVRVSLVIG